MRLENVQNWPKNDQNQPKKCGKQAVAELCQAQVWFKLDSDFLVEELFTFIRKVDQTIKT